MRTSLLALLILLSASVGGAPRRRAVSPDSCSVVLIPRTLSFAATGGRMTVSAAVRGGCALAPASPVSWISTTVAGDSIVVDVLPNTGSSARSAVISVRSGAIVVTQEGAPNLNLIQNGGFDSSVSQWSEIYSVGRGSASWASLSGVITSPGPSTGVATIVSDQPSSGHQLHQCVNVSGSQLYEAGVRTLIPSGQQSAGATVFAIYEIGTPNCTPTNYTDTHLEQRNAPLDTWIDIPLRFTTRSTTRSLIVVIGAGGAIAPPFTAYFDDVYLTPK